MRRFRTPKKNFKKCNWKYQPPKKRFSVLMVAFPAAGFEALKFHRNFYVSILCSTRANFCPCAQKNFPLSVIHICSKLWWKNFVRKEPFQTLFHHKCKSTWEKLSYWKKVKQNDYEYYEIEKNKEMIKNQHIVPKLIS